MEKYSVEGEIGKGSFGKVYKVMNLNGNHLALKVIQIRNKYHAQEAQKEIELLKLISQPCAPSLACYYNSFMKDETLYIEMEYIKGPNLHVFANAKRQSPAFDKFLLSIIGDLVPGLKYMQSKGIIHRDIKPENIVIDQVNKQPKLIDFGLGCLPKIHDECPGKRCCLGKNGSAYFMSPETLLEGKSYFESDIWALGASIYNASTSFNVYEPLEPKLEELIFEMRTYDVGLVSTKNPDLDNILKLMIVKDYTKRITLDQILQLVLSALKK
jgi:serine/threonine protein kinase